MRINDIVIENQIDELNAQDVGAATARGAKAVGGAIKGFAKGFKDEFTGKTSSPAPAAQKKVAMPGKSKPSSGATDLNSIKAAISKLNPKQQQALKKQLAGA